MRKLWNWIRSWFGWDEHEPVEAEPVETAPVYTITHVAANEIRWSGPDLPWTSTTQAGAPRNCVAEAHLYRADGSGGKFDWMRQNTKSRDFKNVHSGYWTRKTGAALPASGETCTLVAVNPAGRVTISEFKWK